MNLKKKRKRLEINKAAIKVLEKNNIDILELAEMGLLEDVVKSMIEFKSRNI